MTRKMQNLVILANAGWKKINVEAMTGQGPGAKRLQPLPDVFKDRHWVRRAANNLPSQGEYIIAKMLMLDKQEVYDISESDFNFMVDKLCSVFQHLSPVSYVRVEVTGYRQQHRYVENLLIGDHAVQQACDNMGRAVPGVFARTEITALPEPS